MDFNLPPNPQPPKNWLASHMVLGYVFIAVILAAAVAGIYYWQTVSNLPADQQVVHKDETATWKTYTNAQYGFEFKYPQDWVSKELPIPNDPHNPYPQLVKFSMVSPEQASFLEKNFNGGVSFDMIDYAGSGYTGSICTPGASTKACSSELRMVNGQQWMVMTTWNLHGPGGELSEKTADIFYKGKMYRFAKYFPDPRGKNAEEINKDNLDIDQILSTFKFTDQASLEQTSTKNPTISDALQIETENLVFKLGVPYSGDMEASGGQGDVTYKWEIIDQKLPPDFRIKIEQYCPADHGLSGPCRETAIYMGEAYPGSEGTNYYFVMKLTSGTESVSKKILISVVQ